MRTDYLHRNCSYRDLSPEICRLWETARERFGKIANPHPCGDLRFRSDDDVDPMLTGIFRCINRHGFLYLKYDGDGSRYLKISSTGHAWSVREGYPGVSSRLMMEFYLRNLVPSN